MLVITEIKEAPKVQDGYEAVFIGEHSTFVAKIYYWGVYPIAPERISNEKFNERADTFLKQIPKVKHA